MTAPDPEHYRWPAEWEPHRGTILTWPHRAEVWGALHDEVQRCFGQLARELSEVEEVHLNLPDGFWRDRVLRELREAGAQGDRLVPYAVDSDDVWARDHGPIFVVARQDAPEGTPPLAMLDWDFNAWGGKFASALDDQVPRRMNEVLDLPRIQPGLVLEGGAVEGNGAGDLLTTEAVLLNSNRNPGHSREAIEESLRTHLGVRRLHWLSSGLTGDDTDGHIDDLARFVAPHTIAAVEVPPAHHADHRVNRANLERLRDFRGAGGRAFEIVPLPVPDPVRHGGEQLPASYANFVIANEKLLVPTFDQPGDARALGLLAELFPTRRVIGIDCQALITQSGALHCITQPIPRVDPP